MLRWIRMVGAAAVLGGVLTGCGGSGASTGSPPTSAAPTATTAPTTTTAREVFDASAVPAFPVRMRMLLSDGWRAQEGAPGTIDLVHTGNPPDDTSQWWGANIAVVDGASVRDPTTASVTDRPPTKADYVPWPDDYFAYLTSLPGVRVEEAAHPIAVNGVGGRQIRIETPAMHPLLWLKDDTAPNGGGRTGVDPAMKREITLFDVGGHEVLVEYIDQPDAFDRRLPTLESVLGTIEFPA